MLLILKIIKIFAPVIPRPDRGIQKKGLEYPVESEADLCEESLRSVNGNYWYRVCCEFSYELDRTIRFHKMSDTYYPSFVT